MVIISAMSLSTWNDNAEWLTTATFGPYLVRVINKNGQPAFAKFIKRGDFNLSATERYKELPHLGYHPHVGQFYEMSTTEDQSHIVRIITTTRVMTDTLYNQVLSATESQRGTLSMSVIVRVLWQLVSVVKHFQSESISINHCEFTPHNIVSDTSFYIVVLDMGMAIPEPDKTSVEPDKTIYRLTETIGCDMYASSEECYGNRMFLAGKTDICRIARIGLFMLHHHSKTNQSKNDATRLDTLYAFLQKMKHPDPNERMTWQEAHDDSLFKGLRT